MSAEISPEGSVELARYTRSGFVESRHIGVAVVLSPDGEIARSLGDVAAHVLPRSTMKFFQALTVLGTGVELEGEELAIVTASHAGTPEHVALVRRVLDRAGVGEDALACPAAYPSDRAARRELELHGENQAPIYMNCSGKHAGMLLACTQTGWPHDGYLDPDHPLQASVRETVQRMTGYRVGEPAIDGCGAPVYAMPLLSLAHGIRKLRLAKSSSPFPMFRRSAAIVDAALQHPWVIDGHGRADTVIMERTGVLTKLGAEGVCVMAAPDGTTAAVKILDGSGRASRLVALELLASVGAVSAAQLEDARNELDTQIMGGNAVVGEITASPLVTSPQE